MKRKSGLVCGMFSCLIILILFISSALAEEEIAIQASPVSGEAPLTVDFSLNSSQAMETYAWDFNSDGQVDSTATAPRHTYTEEGNYLVSVASVYGGNSYSSTKTIQVKKTMTLSVVANPPSGKAPLAVQFTAASTGKEPQAYTWDFNEDGTIESVQQNPSYTFAKAGDYKIKLSVTDATGNTAVKVLLLSVTKYESHLNLTSYFPKNINLGENQITFLVTNEGDDVINEISAKIIGGGVQHLTSTSLSSLNPREEDSLTLKINVLQAGNLTATAKILDKSFPLSFAVNEQVKYNKEEMQAQLNQLKAKLQEQETIYYDKKAQGFLVGDIFEILKAVQKQIQDTQQQILTGKLAEAKVNLDLTSTAVNDFAENLNKVQKQKVTVMGWLKENALAITAIVAALGTLSGILLKVKSHATKVKDQVKEQAQKLGEDMKKKFPLNKKEHRKEPLAEDKAEGKKEENKEKGEKSSEVLSSESNSSASNSEQPSKEEEGKKE